MITEVDKYRGYEIRFCTNRETFQCDIDDERSVKKSYSAVKKFIDEYIKDNSEFKPFKVEPNPKNGWGKPGIITGIRKDGRFILETDDGKKHQISDYEMDRYCLLNQDNEPLKKQIAKLKGDINSLQSQIKMLEEKYITKTLKDIYDQYKPV